MLLSIVTLEEKSQWFKDCSCSSGLMLLAETDLNQTACVHFDVVGSYVVLHMFASYMEVSMLLWKNNHVICSIFRILARSLDGVEK